MFVQYTPTKEERQIASSVKRNTDRETLTAIMVGRNEDGTLNINVFYDAPNVESFHRSNVKEGDEAGQFQFIK